MRLIISLLFCAVLSAQMIPIGGGTYTVPDGKKITVYRNGLLQMPGIDYATTITGIRFLGEQCCEADEIVVIAIY